MKQLITLLLIYSSVNFSGAQNAYHLKLGDLSFKSADRFLEVINTSEKATFKNDFVELSLQSIRNLREAEMERELEQRMPQRDFIVYEEATLSCNSNQKGVFSFATRKGHSSLYSKGIILKDSKAFFVEIKFDASKEDEVKEIVRSFFNIFSNQQEPQGDIETQEGFDENQDSGNETVGSTGIDNKSTTPKHPPVSHPNLIILTQQQKKEFVDAHNRWRADVGVPPLVWSDDLENYAAEWAVINGKKGCVMVHRTDHLYGENIYWSSGMNFNPAYTVDQWGSEIKDYHGEVVGKSKGVVGHYTQVVWRTTTEVGCAAYKCNNELLVICNYNPPGNWVGQHPYK